MEVLQASCHFPVVSFTSPSLGLPFTALLPFIFDASNPSSTLLFFAGSALAPPPPHSYRIGRFLKKKPNDGFWYDVGDRHAAEKASQGKPWLQGTQYFYLLQTTFITDATPPYNCQSTSREEPKRTIREDNKTEREVFWSSTATLWAI